MAQATQGAAKIYGTSADPATPMTFTLYGLNGSSVAGYVVPSVTGVSITHNTENSRTKNSGGEYDSTTCHGEFLEGQFDLLPSGTTEANAILSARIPAAGSTMVIAGASVIPCGSWADAVNVAGGSAPETSRWIYEGGGNLRMTNDGHTVASLTFRRYPNIVGGTAIVT